MTNWFQSLFQSQKVEPATVMQEMQSQSNNKSQAREVPIPQIPDAKEGPWQESPDKWAKSIWDESPTKQELWQESPRKQDTCQVSHSKEGTPHVSQDVWEELPSQQNLWQGSPMHHSKWQQARPQVQLQNSTNRQDSLPNINTMKSADMKMQKQFEDAGKFFSSMTISTTSSRGETHNPFACKTTFGMMDGNKQGQRQSEDLRASTTAFDKVSSPVNPASHGTKSKLDMVSFFFFFFLHLFLYNLLEMFLSHKSLGVQLYSGYFTAKIFRLKSFGCI